MKRFAASIILGLSLMLGTLLGGAGLAGAATPHTLTTCSAACTTPASSAGDGSAFSHTAPTSPHLGSSSSGGSSTVPAATTPLAAVHTPALSSASSLAFTGADVAASVLLGVVLIGGGLLLVRVTRRRSQLA